MHHQRYLESLEAKKHAKYLIVAGIKEENDPAKDAENIVDVLKQIGYDDVQIESMTRLGKYNPENTRPRPIKVYLESAATRKLLKGKGDIYSKIYINKDIHPKDHKELGRLSSDQGGRIQG